LDVLGFNTIAQSWISDIGCDFAGPNWTSGGTSAAVSIFNDNVSSPRAAPTRSGRSDDQQPAHGGGRYAGHHRRRLQDRQRTFFANTFGTIEVSTGILDGEVNNAGTIEAVGGTLDLLGTLTGAGREPDQFRWHAESLLSAAGSVTT